MIVYTANEPVPNESPEKDVRLLRDFADFRGFLPLIARVSVICTA
jgi:hypothetical protein